MKGAEWSNHLECSVSSNIANTTWYTKIMYWQQSINTKGKKYRSFYGTDALYRSLIVIRNVFLATYMNDIHRKNLTKISVNSGLLICTGIKDIIFLSQKSTLLFGLSYRLGCSIDLFNFSFCNKFDGAGINAAISHVNVPCYELLL